MISAELSALVARARAERAPQQITDAIPYARFVGLELALEEDRLVGVLRYRDSNIGDATLPALHGGTLAALLESTAILAVLWEGDLAVLPRTITLTIDYLRSGRPVDAVCRAEVVRRGKRITVVAVRAYQEQQDEPIAAAMVHLLTADDG